MLKEVMCGKNLIALIKFDVMFESMKFRVLSKCKSGIKYVQCQVCRLGVKLKSPVLFNVEAVKGAFELSTSSAHRLQTSKPSSKQQ